jgi:hypothetical protein
MRKCLISLPSLLLAVFFHSTAHGDEVPVIATAKDLLLPCQEADNDPRDGYLALLECTRYIHGFLAGLDASGIDPSLCFPETNRDDEIRRGFVRWVHGSFSKRSKIPAGEALHMALNEAFGCD